MSINFKKYKNITSIILLFSSFFLYSGCSSLKTLTNSVLSSFESEILLPEEVVVTLSGKLKKEDSLFNSYSFISENSDIFSVTFSNNLSQKVSNYVNKNVVITGLISNFKHNEKTNNITFEKNITIIDIAYFIDKKRQKELKEKKNKWTIFTPKYFDISFSYPLLNFSIDEKILTTEEDINIISKIITEYDNSIFYTITKNIDEGWQKKFKNEGVEIQLGRWNAYRLFSGKQILFYIPNLNIQIDYWGEKKDIHFFYTILKTIHKYKNINEKTLKGTETENESKDKKDRKIKNIIKSSIEKPSISLALEQILTYPSQYLENTDEYQNRIIIDKIEYFDNFISVEYKILGKDKNESVLKAKIVKKLFSVEWKSIFMKTLDLQLLVEWKQGKDFLWEIVDGNIPNIGEFKKYFLQNVNLKYIFKIPENFIIYFSPQYKYSIIYPKKMYYEIFNNNDIIEGVRWSNSPFNTHKENTDIFDIQLLLKKGNFDNYTEEFSENSIVIPKSNSAYFILKGGKNIKFSLLQKMAKRIVLY